MQINICQVDAFSENSFGGNPAGVVPDSRLLTKDKMQKVAKEMNLSETAFVTQLYDDLFDVRFFTPECEVDLCGHATIGAFFTMASKGYIKPICNGSKIVYQRTKAGKLSVELIYKNGFIDKVYMEQVKPKSFGKVENLNELLEAMGISLEDIGKIDPEIISTGLAGIMLPIRKKEILDNLNVNLELLKKVSKDNKVIGVHAFYLPEIDSEKVYTRNFAPLIGINEEAATGTANGALIYFLKKNFLTRKNKILSYQGESMDRPSEVYCIIDNEDTVKVGGKSKLIIDGIMCI